MTLTKKSFQVFIAAAKEAKNWGGEPWICMIPKLNLKHDKGNLSDLVKKGLIEIHDHEEKGRSQDMYLIFTERGKMLATSHNITIK